MTVTGEPSSITADRRGPPMDPRIQQRRIEVKRHDGRRRLRFLLASLAVLAAGGGAVGATRSPLLDVDHVTLRGAQHTSLGEVADATKLHRQPLMVEVDTPSLARKVESLPWVLRARVERQWPATVRISVVERAPAAAAASDQGRWAVVDGTGRVLAVGPERPANLPAVAIGAVAPNRPGASLPAGAEGILRVAAALPAPLQARVGEVAGVAGGSIELRLRTGGTVRLGPPDDLQAKLAAALTVIEKAAGGGFAVLDVRAPQTPVLTRR